MWILITCGDYHVIVRRLRTILLLRIPSLTMKQGGLLMVCWSQASPCRTTNHQTLSWSRDNLVVILKLWSKILCVYHEVMRVPLCYPTFFGRLDHGRKLKLPLIRLILSTNAINSSNYAIWLVRTLRIILWQISDVSWTFNNNLPRFVHSTILRQQPIRTVSQVRWGARGWSATVIIVKSIFNIKILLMIRSHLHYRPVLCRR